MANTNVYMNTLVGNCEKFAPTKLPTTTISYIYSKSAQLLASRFYLTFGQDPTPVRITCDKKLKIVQLLIPTATFYTKHWIVKIQLRGRASYCTGY